MTKPPTDHALAAAGATLLILTLLYFSYPGSILGLLWKAFESGRLSFAQYLVARDVMLYPVDRLADRFPAYKLWAFGHSEPGESKPIKDL